MRPVINSLRVRGFSGKDQRGFTLIEVLVVIALTGVLVTLGAAAFRHYWFVKEFESSQGELVAHLRRLQQQTVAETDPVVFGVRFRPSEAGEYRVIKYDPENPLPSACKGREVVDFQGSVEFTSVDFAPAPASLVNDCNTAGVTAATDELVFFFARGNATGAEITLASEQLSGRVRSVSVNAVTGRVDES